jgi:hypothetical protein
MIRSAVVVLVGGLVGALGCSSNNSGVRTTGSGGTVGGGGIGGMSMNGTGGAGAGISSGGCSIYQKDCGGQCLTVATDPQNCGGCGIKCPSGQVCSGGACTGSCLPGSGLAACNGACVDKSSDNANCGSCGHACPATQGCVGGSCVTATIFPPPASCAGGGPPVTVGTGNGMTKCAGLIAQTTFTWSVCSCKDVNFSDSALIDGWDSTTGTYKSGQLGGGVGADNSITTQSGADIWGDSTAASMSTSYDISGLTVHHDLASGGNITGDGLSVTRNATVAGNIGGDATIGGTLYQPAGKSHPSGVTLVQKDVTVAPPCDCSKPIDVAGMVAWAKTNNQDAAIGLDPGLLTNGGGGARVDLPCGVYYMTGFSNTGSIVAHGNVALFIDGDVGSSGDLTLTVADGASAFDIFVSGTIVAQSNFTLGSPNYPALTRLYIGGTQTLDMQAGLVVGAEIWAGNATVLWEGSADVFGAIFAGNFQVLDKLNLHHDEAVDKAGGDCTPPPSTGTGGSGGGTCGTCKDCGNQACVNGACGACTTDADCCAPLGCSNGQCISIIHIS